MLIKLTSIVGKVCVLVNNKLIDTVALDNNGITMVYFSKEIKIDGKHSAYFMLAVEETPEEIYEQQFKTCESSL